MEACFTIPAVVIGIGLGSYLTGLASSALLSEDMEEAEKRQKIETTLRYLKHKDVPYFFQRIVLEYYWNSGDSNTNDIMDSLPGPIQLRLSLLLNRHLLTTIPMLKQLELNCILLLMQNLASERFLPGEFVYRIGDEPSHLLFVQSGRVSMLLNEDFVYNSLNKGDMFGHVAMFNDEPHTVSAKCTDYSDILYLDKVQFQEQSKLYYRFQDYISSEVKREERAIEASRKNYEKHAKKLKKDG